MQDLMCLFTKQTGTTTFDLDLTTDAFLAMGHLASPFSFLPLNQLFLRSLSCLRQDDASFHVHLSLLASRFHVLLCVLRSSSQCETY